MVEISTEFDEEIPKWDVALEALIREECWKTARPLAVADFRRLANRHAIRFDDIMATVFELTLHGEWEYLDAQGVVQSFRRADIERLYVNGRIADEDVKGFLGGWRPAGKRAPGPG